MASHLRINNHSIVINPYNLPKDKTLLSLISSLRALNIKKDITWIQSTGTSGEVKYIGLSVDQIKSSVKSSSSYFKYQKNDIYVSLLPDFHISGAMIRWRCEYKDMVNKKLKFEELGHHDFHWISLVPTQVQKILKNKIQPPNSIKASLIGGGFLTYEAYEEFKNLGWKPVCVYGMSETGAHFSVGEFSRLDVKQTESDKAKLQYRLLDGFSIAEEFLNFDKENQNKQYCLKGDAVCEGILVLENEKWIYKKMNSSLLLEDKIRLNSDGKSFELLGRGRDFKKVGGKSVSLNKLRERFAGKNIQFKFEDDINWENRIYAYLKNCVNLNQNIKKLKEWNLVCEPEYRVGGLYILTKATSCIEKESPEKEVPEDEAPWLELLKSKSYKSLKE